MNLGLRAPQREAANPKLIGHAQLSPPLLNEKNPIGSARLAKLKSIFDEGKSIQLQFPAENLGFSTTEITYSLKTILTGSTSASCNSGGMIQQYGQNTTWNASCRRTMSIVEVLSWRREGWTANQVKKKKDICCSEISQVLLVDMAP
ncbi:hypothetical protein AAC387_Pa07g2391 [Persea americana]